MSGHHHQKKSLFRERKPDEHQRVTFIELFFDLVFVFAVTQLSHRLIGDFTARGALETALLLLAVWWVWVYTSWITNWLDPERPAVRLMLVLLMVAGLGMSTSIPEAFTSRGLVFAASYAAMQVGRTLFMVLAIPRTDHVLRQNFVRILIWLASGAVPWILGGLATGPARVACWCAALILEYAGPILRYWVPILGASKVSDWTIEGAHLAERFALFIIIALGESVLVTGATFADCVWSAPTLAAFLSAFVGTVAMWWIYFDKGAELGVEQITHARDPGRLGRVAYTYLHLPIVAGIILGAVADELVLHHPTGHTDTKTAISAVGGPLAYLVGVVLFKHTLRGWYQPSHLAGIAALAALGSVTTQISPLALSALSTLVLMVVAGWETLSLKFRHPPSRS